MIYSETLADIDSVVFRRKDLLDAIKKANPNYNVQSFNRHFSKILSSSPIECVGEDMYISVTPDSARQAYTHAEPSSEFLDVEAFLNTVFPLVDLVIWETFQLNEFLNHQLAQNTIIVMVERLLMDTVFQRLQQEFSSALFAPTANEYERYWQNGTIIVEKLSYRYPKNRKQKRGYSIEKLVVDLFAESTIKMMVSTGDYPAALETAFGRYIINETRLFDYARTRYVNTELLSMIQNETSINLYTKEGNQ